MKRISLACVATALLATGLRLTAAEGARFKHVVSIYFDGQGTGLKLPEAVACGTNGQIVVGDTGNDRLLRFTYRDNTLSGGAEIKTPELVAPTRVQLNSQGEIYALDGMKRRIARFGPEGDFKGSIDFGNVPAPAAVVPKAFAIDPDGNIYVLDVLGARVLVLNAQAQFQKALPLPGNRGFVTDLAVDAAGQIILLDSTRRRLSVAAKSASSFEPLGGDLTEFVPTLPASIASQRGAIFIVEGPGSGIVRFGSDGSFLSRQLTKGWDDGSLNHPAQMCISDKDEVVVADRDNSRVQVFQMTR